MREDACGDAGRPDDRVRARHVYAIAELLLQTAGREWPRSEAEAEKPLERLRSDRMRP
jgi:hypothetical protein